MNERLRELMIEAGKSIPGDKHIDADFCQKFAELIVWECANSLAEIEDEYVAVLQSHMLEQFGMI